MKERLRFKIKNDIEELKKLNLSARTFLGTIDISSKTIYKVNLILEEMITNIIKYGFDDNKKHHIEVDINITDEFIRIRIIDDGIEFNSSITSNPDTDLPLEKMRIGGLGIFLVKNFSNNNIKYRRHKKKNVLRIKIATLDE